MYIQHNEVKKMVQQKTSNCYCLQTRQAASAMKNYYDNFLNPSGVTVRQFSLLLNISKLSSCSIRELADAAGLDKSTLARSIKPLVKSGYVFDSKSVNERNSKLSLTAKGITTLNYAAKLWAEAQKSLENKFGKKGMEQLISTLNLLNNL